MSATRGSSPKKSASERFLLVRAGEIKVAVQLSGVRRVLHSVRIHPIPGSASSLLGLLQHDGEPIPVVDLARLLAEEEQRTSGEYAIIVAGGVASQPELLALCVHDAISVVNLDSRSFAGSENSLLSGEVMLEGDRVRVLDLASLGGSNP